MVKTENEKKIDALMLKREKLEEKCDTMPKCAEGKGCPTCDIYAKMNEIDEQVDALEPEEIDVSEGEEEE